ncbi:MAG: hypothetical protein MUE60_11855 [Candidatus Eisenbacteria bacterium]|jgi:hypothetical protein|nr:hypothetical protein [Candidatus Eisenbacteria bacterium]
MRWGEEDENVFARLGAPDDVTIGHGFVVRHFTNWYDEDFRRLGLHFSGRTSRFGGRTFSSSVGRWEVAGVRLWAEPFTGLRRPLPPCRMGLTMVTDFDPDSRTAKEDGIAVLAADADIPLALDSAVSVAAAVDLATIMGHGWGGAMGLSGDFGRLAGVSGLKCRLERRFIGPDFMTEYVDAFYGVDRFVPAGDSGKADALGGESGGGGWYGEVQGVLLGMVAFAAGCSRVQGRSRTGVPHVNMSPRPIRERWEVRLSLNKARIRQLRDITRRDRPLLETTAGYRIRPWAWLCVRSRQTFEKQGAGYSPVSVVVPRISLSVTF